VETLDNVKELVVAELSELGYTLSSMKLSKGKDAILEVVIDREAPINLDDITIVSNTISKLLDEHDFINGSYVLDVSSLGIEKPIDLENIEKYVGQYVNVHTTHPVKELSYVEGTLNNVTEDSIEVIYFIKGKKTKAVLDRKFIDKARLAIKF